MTDDNSRKRLGRGLATLIGELDPVQESESESPRPDRHVAIEFIQANPNNPRVDFDAEDLADLANSIREHGVIQPILVRSIGGADHSNDMYEIVAGERRWRAAQIAELSSLPVLVRELDDRQALELAIIENVQRSDLNPVEEAKGYQRLLDEHGYTQNELGTVIGKSRSHVANTLRLLKLPESVQAFVFDGSLSAGHARTLVNADDPEKLAKKIVAEGLSVRQAEKLAQVENNPERNLRKNPDRNTASTADKDADTLALEKSLSDVLGLKVSVNHNSQGSGDVNICYGSLEQLDEICRRLM